MATERLVPKKRISSTHIRELDVYYDKDGMNYRDYSQKPKGIFFASMVFEQEEGSAWKTLKIGIGSKTPGVGYVLVTPLDNYRLMALREVRARVQTHTKAIHALCDIGDAEAMARLKAILTGVVLPVVAAAGT